MKELENLLDMGYSKKDILERMEVKKETSLNSLNFSKNNSEIKLIKNNYQPKLKILLSK